MKIRMIVTAALLSFFIVTVETNAEMKISPDGVTFPDSSVQTKAVSGGGVSAPLHLGGSFCVVGVVGNPDGAVVSGVNEYSDAYPTYGGDLTAAGDNGLGVYGFSSGSNGTGVWGGSSGTTGYGVYGSASNVDWEKTAADIFKLMVPMGRAFLATPLIWEPQPITADILKPMVITAQAFTGRLSMVEM